MQVLLLCEGCFFLFEWIQHLHLKMAKPKESKQNNKRKKAKGTKANDERIGNFKGQVSSLHQLQYQISCQSKSQCQTQSWKPNKAKAKAKAKVKAKAKANSICTCVCHLLAATALALPCWCCCCWQNNVLLRRLCMATKLVRWSICAFVHLCI